MTASELIVRLQKLVERHGDLEVIGHFDAGYGGGPVDAYWLTSRGDGPHIAIEVNEGGYPLWRQLPESQWPPEDERAP